MKRAILRKAQRFIYVFVVFSLVSASIMPAFSRPVFAKEAPQKPSPSPVEQLKKQPEAVSQGSEVRMAVEPGGGLPDPISPIYASRQPLALKVGTGGEAAVSESTGAFVYTLPLNLPKGRAELQPALAMSYNSQNTEKDSFVGFGWDLDIPSVVRDESVGTNRLYATGSQAFILDFKGAGRLRPIAVDGNGFGEYGAETESGFLKIEFLPSNVWKVTDTVGTVLYFGQTAASRQDDPQDATRIFGWMLEEIRDTNDNFVRFEYLKDSGQIYPKRVLYTGSGLTDGIFEVAFEPFASGPAVERPDTLKAYTSGFEVTTRYRLDRVNIFANGVLKRFYLLSYVSGSNQNRSLLQSVTEGGKDSAGNDVLQPATTFEYGAADTTWERDPNYTFSRPFEWYNQEFTWGYGTQKFQWADVNGDGLTDILYSEKECSSDPEYLPKKQAYINNGINGWDEVSTYLPQIYFFPQWCGVTKYVAQYKKIRYLDVNGDGFTDYLESYFVNNPEPATINNVYLNNKVDGWTYDPAWHAPFVFAAFDSTDILSEVYQDYNARFKPAHINGDNLLDFVMAYVDQGGLMTKRVYLNRGDGTWEMRTDWEIPQLFANDTTMLDYIAMMEANGDGLDDIVYSYVHYDSDGITPIHDQRVYLNNGVNGWYQQPGWTVPFPFVQSLQVYQDYTLRFEIMDANADGLQDFMYSWFENGNPVQDIKKTYLNNGVNGWAYDPAYVPPVYFSFDTHDGRPKHRIGSSFGLGVTDLFRSYTQMEGGDFQYRDLYRTTNAQRTDKMTAIRYNASPVVGVTYDVSSRLRNASGQLLSAKLPMAVSVAKNVTYNPGFGTPIVSTYSYSDGFFRSDQQDVRSARFTGFGKVEKTTGNSKAVAYFHQGGGYDGSAQGEYNDSFYKIGKPYRTEVYDVPSGVLKEQTVSKWDEYTVALNRKFVFKAEESKTNFVGGTKSSAARFTHDFTNGNLLTEENLGEVTVNTATGAITNTLPGDEKTTEKEYAQNATKHILAAPKLGTLAAGAESRLQNVYYDQLPLGQVDKVNPTKEEFNTSQVQVQRTFNSFGLPDTETDPKLNVTTVSYDAVNLYPSTTTNPLTQATKTEYDVIAGQVSRSADANGGATEQTYDPFGRPLVKQVSNPQSPATLITVQEVSYADTAIPRYAETKDYFAAGQFKVSREYFDGLGRSIQKKSQLAASGQWSTVDTTYDAQGRVSRASLPYVTATNAYAAPDLTKPATSYTYDALDRVLTETTPLGTTTYSYNGWTVTITDPENHVKDITRDAHGNVKTVVEHKGASLYTTSYEYNVSNKLTKITDAAGNIRNFTYNDLDRLTTQNMVHRPGTTGATESYTSYDNNGNLLSKNSFNSLLTQYTYDALNRVKTEKLGTATMITYTYDQGTNGKGHLTSVLYDNGDMVSYTYDILGRRKSETHIIKNTSYTTSYDYNLSGSLSRVIYPDNAVVEYDFNPIGQVSQVRMNKGAGFETIATNIQYNANGQMAHLERSNGVTTDYTYVPAEAYRLQNLHTAGPGGDLQNITYDYSPVGNIETIIDTAPTPIAKSATFGYDDLNRLTSAAVTYTNTPASNYSVTYDYDAIGNMTVDSSGGTRVYGSNHPHQLTSVGGTAITYDNAGSVSGEGAKVFWYDWRYRMNANRADLYSNITTRYRYGYDNQRYLKYTEDASQGAKGKKGQTSEGVALADGAPITIATPPIQDGGGGGGGGGGPVITSEERYPGTYHQVNLLNQKKDHIFLGTQKLGTLNNTTSLFFDLSDHLGSSSIRTGSTGTITETRDLKPYGALAYENIAQSSDNQYKFTGKERDTETSQDYFGARYYQNAYGRFTGADPVLLLFHAEDKFKQLAGKDVKIFLTDPQLLNVYSYTRNNPLAFVDPDGNAGQRINPYMGMIEGQRQIAQFLFSAAELVRTQGGILGNSSAFVSGVLGNVANSTANLLDPATEPLPRMFAFGTLALDVGSGGGKKAAAESFQAATKLVGQIRKTEIFIGPAESEFLKPRYAAELIGKARSLIKETEVILVEYRGSLGRDGSLSRIIKRLDLEGSVKSVIHEVIDKAAKIIHSHLK